MKKLVLASAMALASVALVASPTVRAQDNSGQISLPPEQFNAYQNATTQSDPAVKASALENFLKQYPQTPVKNAVYDQLMDAYQQANDLDKAVDAASRLLQVDPNNMKAIFFSVFVKKTQCSKNVDPATGESKDPQTCDDAAALAQKGLTVPKPAALADADWKKMTDAAYPMFHSAIALDDAIAKKDYAGAIKEYTTELMLYPADLTTKGPGLVDTLNVAEAYAKPGPGKDEVKAVWFYARAWDFAPPAYKAQIEQKLDYWYKRYHGTIDTPQQITQQIDAIKTQAQATLFPPSTFSIAPAPTPAELAHHALTSGDPKALNLEDKEFILANGSQQDAQQLWTLLQGQVTPVPGIVMSDPATVLKVSVTTAASPKPKEYTVKLNNPVACNAVPPPPSELKVKEAMDYLQANGAAADVSAIEEAARARKILIEPAVVTINMAVTQDAKDNKIADFTVNLKEPLSCKDAPEVNAQLATQPQEELDGTYDTYTTVAASGANAARAQIVLKEGFVQLEKKAPPVHHRPPAGHRAHPGE